MEDGGIERLRETGGEEEGGEGGGGGGGKAMGDEGCTATESIKDEKALAGVLRG